MKWIKASERLPDKDGWIYLKCPAENPAVIYYKAKDKFLPPSYEWLDESINQDLSQCSNACDWPKCTQDNCADKKTNQEGSLKDSDWKEKLKEVILNYDYLDSVINYVEEKLLAPLLQNELKGDDLVAEQPVSAKIAHTEIGGSPENGRWVNRREREPEKTGKYKIRYALTDFDDCFEEAEETYYNQSGWNKHGYAQFVMAWWEESNTKEQEEKYYPGIQHQRLFNAISETKGIATQSDMDEIIRIVHEDFPLWIPVNDRLPDCKDKSTAYDGLFSERVLIVEEHQNKQRIDISNCRLDDINVDGFIAYKQQAPTHKWGVQGNNMNVTHWMPLPKSPTELVNLERNASPRTHNQGDEAGNKNKTSNSEATILSALQILKKHHDFDEGFTNYEKNCVLAAMEEFHNQFK